MAIEPKKSVLVVEDSVDLLEIIQEHLEGEGYDVFPASHGKQAIDFLTDLQGTQPELVVLDLMMPIVSGWDVLKQMRSHPRFDTIPVLVMTAAPTQTTPEGATAMIKKPFNVGDFLKAVQATRRVPGGRPTTVPPTGV